ncbi:MAG: metallopeptidase family protein [Alphaproteobacteria bacterium]
MTIRKTNLNLPPSISDISKIAYDALSDLPKDFLDFSKNMIITVKDLPDDDVILEMGLESPFDLLARLETSSDFLEGWRATFSDVRYARQSFVKQDNLYLYRRSILDYWCETSEDLAVIVKKAIIGELGDKMGICDDDMDFLEDDFPSFFNHKIKK